MGWEKEGGAAVLGRPPRPFGHTHGRCTYSASEPSRSALRRRLLASPRLASLPRCAPALCSLASPRSLPRKSPLWQPALFLYVHVSIFFNFLFSSLPCVPFLVSSSVYPIRPFNPSINPSVHPSVQSVRPIRPSNPSIRPSVHPCNPFHPSIRSIRLSVRSIGSRSFTGCGADDRLRRLRDGGHAGGQDRLAGPRLAGARVALAPVPGRGRQRAARALQAGRGAPLLCAQNPRRRGHGQLGPLHGASARSPGNGTDPSPPFSHLLPCSCIFIHFLHPPHPCACLVLGLRLRLYEPTRFTLCADATLPPPASLARSLSAPSPRLLVPAACLLPACCVWGHVRTFTHPRVRARHKMPYIFVHAHALWCAHHPSEPRDARAGPGEEVSDEVGLFHLARPVRR